MLTSIAIRTPGSDDDRVSSLQEPSVSHPRPDVQFGAPLLTEFEKTILPHLDAAYNLARWLTHDPVDAENLVQDACIRASRCRAPSRNGNGRIWLLRIVRNAFYAKLKTQRIGGEFAPCGLTKVNGDDGPQLDTAVAALPIELRECLILRELEEFSYKEIAFITGVSSDVVATRRYWARRLLGASCDQDRQLL